MKDVAQSQIQLPNNFKFLTKNRHIDRDFDVEIKLKEPEATKVIQDLVGGAAGHGGAAGL